MSKDEYYSTHKGIQDIQMGKELKLHQMSMQHELDDVRRSLKAILDKLYSMDMYMRRAHYDYKGKTYNGDDFEKAVIKQFLEDVADRRYSPEDLKKLEKGEL